MSRGLKLSVSRHAQVILHLLKEKAFEQEERVTFFHPKKKNNRLFANSWFPSNKSKMRPLKSHYTAFSVIMWPFMAELSGIQMGGNLRSPLSSVVRLSCVSCSFMSGCRQVGFALTLANAAIEVKPQSKKTNASPDVAPECTEIFERDVYCKL